MNSYLLIFRNTFIKLWKTEVVYEPGAVLQANQPPFELLSQQVLFTYLTSCD